MTSLAPRFPLPLASQLELSYKVSRRLERKLVFIIRRSLVHEPVRVGDPAIVVVHLVWSDWDVRGTLV